MVARNFTLQDFSYNHLLQVPEEERDFLSLNELKQHQLTELGVSISSTPTQPSLVSVVSADITNPVISTGGLLQNYHHHNVFYGVNALASQANANTAENDGLTVVTASTIAASNAALPDPAQRSMSTVSSINSHQQDSQEDGNQHSGLDHGHHHQVSSSVNGGENGVRKRKLSYTDNSDAEEDTADDAKSNRTTDDSKKQNHSEIEKRRRDKMNSYITELSAMIPMCHAMSRKLDKLTVLRMAVQHLKTIRGAVHSYTEGHYKPAFLSDQELKMLILQAAEGFLFVVGCDRGRILYVSESVSQVLNYSQGDLLGQSWFDILHPKDVAKVKEQLSSSDLSPRERLIDAKTMLPVKTDVPQGATKLCPGARRSFFCRMKCKTNIQVKEESETNTSSASCHRRKNKMNTDKKYSVIQCTGYLKSWAPAKIGLDEHGTDGENDSCNLSCLVAVGRVQPNLFQNHSYSNVNFKNQPSTDNNGGGSSATGSAATNNYKRFNRHNIQNLRNVQFISRHAMDGKFLFVDQRATWVLGFLPQELLGTSMYEYYHHEDIPALAESHKAALQGTQCVTTSVYKLRTKENGFVRVQSEWKSFRNPWTKEIEYLIAKNNVILSDLADGPGGNCIGGGATMQRKGNGGNNELIDGNNETNGQSTVECDIFDHSNGTEIQRIINSHVEASKIGRQIAEIVLDTQRRIGESSTESSPNPADVVLPQKFNPSGQDANSLSSEVAAAVECTLVSESVVSSVSSGEAATTQRNNGSLPEYGHVRKTSPEHESPHAQGNDGNDEAAMAVIMSLLEADAGLGGPVDFSGLPWPLP
ncbi:basic helix-loop-helix ARNT-like protein 1 isoform X2 [Toxorhynchites rutilus septentrionalis]|uniref:basic helix-loop-helix ARNT-like protein 1 isoform X2 n=1 Tax=Toxorhynchites rutilus septentrionalis TaxID=329112 RepID=UPI002479F9F6|nr:basic helix-loop-helix ARNT-like protein 1 isoform X2 [Toxorhynchites rutilus septentrionalis]